MRILIAHSFYRLPGGEDRYVVQQRDLLASRHDVELFSARNDELDGGPSTAARMVYSRARREEATDVIRRFRPDVVHLHNAYPALGPAIALAADRLGVPIVMTVHNYRLRCPNGYLFTEGAVCRRCETGRYWNAVTHRCFPMRRQAAGYAAALWLHRFALRLERTVSSFIAPSAFVANQLRTWGVADDRVRLVRNFTDVEPSPPSPPGRGGLFVGRLSPEKGVDVLIRALRLASDPPFLVVGDGPQRRRLERVALDEGLTRTTFAGRLPTTGVRNALRNARFVAFPSLWHENAPLAAFEAMASARPLVVTRRGGLPELADGGRGLVCESGDPHALAAAMRRFFEDDRLCADAGLAARSFASEKLNPQTHLIGLERAYEAVSGAVGTLDRSRSDGA